MYANYTILDKSLYLIMGLLNIPLLFIVAPVLLLIVVLLEYYLYKKEDWYGRLLFSPLLSSRDVVHLPL